MKVVLSPLMVRIFIGFARGNSNCLEGDYFDIAYILSEYVYNIFVKCYVFMNENVIMNHLYNSKWDYSGDSRQFTSDCHGRYQTLFFVDRPILCPSGQY